MVVYVKFLFSAQEWFIGKASGNVVLYISYIVWSKGDNYSEVSSFALFALLYSNCSYNSLQGYNMKGGNYSWHATVEQFETIFIVVFLRY